MNALHTVASGLTATALLSITGCHTTGTASPPSKGSPIEMAAFLVGEWMSETGATRTWETWSPPRGGLMLCSTVTVKDDKAVFFEFLRIEERGDGVVFIAQPRGKPPTEFTLGSHAADRVTFVNPANDYPKRITYALQDGHLMATIDGGEDAPAGSPPAQSWRLTRVQPAGD